MSEKLSAEQQKLMEAFEAASPMKRKTRGVIRSIVQSLEGERNLGKVCAAIEIDKGLTGWTLREKVMKPLGLKADNVRILKEDAETRRYTSFIVKF